MNSLKKILFFAVVLMSTTIQKSYGQAAILAIIFGDKVASEEFNLSLELGSNYSSVSNFEDIKRTNETNFGLGCNFKLSERFYFSPSVYFLSGRKFNFSSYSLNTGEENLDSEYMNTSGNASMNYIDLPAILWFQVNKIRFGAGPQVSFLTQSELSFNGSEGEFIQDIKTNTNNIDYGLMGAISYELGKARKGKGIFIQARYYHGFADIYSDDIALKNNQLNYFSIHLSLPFITDELAKKNLELK
jgi:hypothetical protein